MAHGYEDRLIAYMDILGWKNAIDGLTPEKLVEALELIHEQPRNHSEAERTKLIEFGKQPAHLFARQPFVVDDDRLVLHPVANGLM